MTGDEIQDPLTRDVLGAAFEVANALGHGFLEAVYRRALIRELGLRGLGVQEEVTFPVSYKGEVIGRYIADLVVERRVLLELKCAERLAPAHVAQTLNYIRASGLPVALLINFGQPRLEYRRLACRAP